MLTPRDPSDFGPRADRDWPARRRPAAWHTDTLTEPDTDCYCDRDHCEGWDCPEAPERKRQTVRA